jgi:hypothetical protein
MPKLVLMALADEADDTGFCFPSQRRLAWKCTISERTVRRMVCLLASQRYLAIEPRFAKDRSRTSNGYRLAFGDPPDKLTRGVSSDHDPLANRDRGPRSALTRGMDSSVQVTTTYPLSFPKPQPPAQHAPCRELRPNRHGGSRDVGGRGGDLCLPEGLSLAQRRGINEQLKDVDRTVAQQLIDELAGRMRATEVRNPVGYCVALISRLRRGEFAPELGLAIAAERLAGRQQNASASTGPSASSMPPVDTAATALPPTIRASLERLRSKLEPQSSSEPMRPAVRPQEMADGSSEP